MGRGGVPETRFVERRTIVAITPRAQRDEPPGRGEWRDEEVVLVGYEFNVAPSKVSEVVREVAAKGIHENARMA